ncbi:MAG TPA: zinc ribbon domain-containing protein [Aridibacter sp.]|nr:zinc ribbon domain-containing protein [Aridibacter sp.]
MFCPNCGRDNSAELKFCASCGTNLEAVSRALTGREEDVVTRLDTNLDQFISRYTEHVFAEPKPGSGEHSVVRSWRLLGQALVTTMIDLFLFILMWNIMPIRFLLLLITSPIRLLKERSGDAADLGERPLAGSYSPPAVEGGRDRLLGETFPSVTEETTTNLGGKFTDDKSKAPITDKLEDDEK